MKSRNHLYNKRDIALCRPIYMYIVLTVVCVFGREIWPIFPDLYFTFLRYGITLILLIRALQYIPICDLFIMSVLYIVFGVSYFYSYITGYLIIEDAMTYCITTYMLCIPFFICAKNIHNVECLRHGLMFTSYISLAILTIYVFTHIGFTESGAIKYSMPASYQLLLCALLYIDHLYLNRKYRLLYILLASLCASLIFIHGARGPLFCLAVYIVLKTLIEQKENPRVKIIILVLVITIVIAATNYEYIILALGRLVSAMGLQSRMMDHLASKTMFNSDSRLYFMNAAWVSATNNPIIGTGAASDIVLLGGQYAHNLFLELCVDFGLFIGSILFIWVTILTIKSLFLSKSSRKDIMLIFTTCGYCMLQISGTYLQSIYLFMFIGFALQKNCNEHITLQDKSKRIYTKEVPYYQCLIQ